MADIAVKTGISANASTILSTWGTYYISKDIGICIYEEETARDLLFARTTNGSDASPTWTQGGTAITTDQTRNLACYLDRETPGDTGALLHVAYMVQSPNEIRHRTVDISDGTLGTEHVIDTGVTVVASGDNQRITIAKSRSGNLMVAFVTAADIECYTAASPYTSWTDRADVFEATGADQCLLFPANTGDDNDFAAWFWDESADQISCKIFDDSDGTPGSWFETTILSSMVEELFRMHFDGATRHSDGLLLGCAHTDHATSTDDLKTWTVNPNVVGPTSVGVSIKTDVFTDQAESGYCALHINQQNDDVRIAYMKGGTWNATVDVVYKVSTDDMATWGTEADPTDGNDETYSEAVADDVVNVHATRSTGNDGGRFQPAFLNKDTDILYVNKVNDVEIAASVAGGIPLVMHHRKMIGVS